MFCLILGLICCVASLLMYLDDEQSPWFAIFLAGVINLLLAVAILNVPADPHYQSRTELDILVERCELRLTRDRRCELVAVPIPLEK